MRLTLLVPELIWPEPADQQTLGKLAAPGFEWLTGHASFTRQPRLAYETALARLFGLHTPALGALRLLGENKGEAAVDGHWLCADPVHLRFHHERIILADTGAFAFNEDEAQAIATSLNAEFADIGHLQVATARRWYLRLNPANEGALEHVAEPLSAIAGRQIDSELTEHNATLTRWLNEVQMFLHGHPVNEQRQAAGLPVINSLWLWGGGRLNRPSPGHFTAVWSDNPLAIGLARASGVPVHPPTGDLAGVLRLASKGTSQLVVLDQLLPTVLYEDGEGWREVWENLEQHWLTPLRQALGRPVKQLTVVAPSIYGELVWTLHGNDRWKFWRRGLPLAALAHRLAGEKP